MTNIIPFPSKKQERETYPLMEFTIMNDGEIEIFVDDSVYSHRPAYIADLLRCCVKEILRGFNG